MIENALLLYFGSAAAWDLPAKESKLTSLSSQDEKNTVAESGKSRRIPMLVIRDLVKQVLDTGYLTVETEENLRCMLRRKYSQEDFNAFMKLQQAAMRGKIKQESRELYALLSV